MSVDSRIVARLTALVEMGQEVLDRYDQSDEVRIEASLEHWLVSSDNALSRVFGTDSLHYQRFREAADGRYQAMLYRACGVLRAARDDYEHGFLFSLRDLIRAELFDDFLDHAAHLESVGYFQPAAVVTGAVLEDGLRKLCLRAGVVLCDKPKLDSMNADLAKANIYNKLVQKQITAWADLRNKAAHGHWDQFTDADVKQMLVGVRHFMATHFT